MNLIKKLISAGPFASYSRKVDNTIRDIISVKKAKQIPIIVLFRRNIDTIMEARLKKMRMKIKYSLPFINGICGIIPVSSFENLYGILEIEKIFYDSKAHLMGNPLSQGIEAAADQAPKIKSSYFSGKGVTVAFVDSGVYPHPDLITPRNRIIEFKDFINNNAFPYDDNGHGTACIGAGFGASAEGKFRAAAYEAGIVCAKAFDSFGAGFYSDILAAMQWIVDLKEKLNISIAVLPFGTASFSKSFDILSIAVEKLWKNNIFVCTCAGNLGPYDSSITSPGVSPFSYTSAACSTLELPPKAASFSGKGPVYNKCDKPDVIMPGVDMETLNSETSYKPIDKAGAKAGRLPVQYTRYSGTSISASLTAAAAALVYQRRKGISPDDVKSILKSCTVSINELRNIQGSGIIDIKKLEDI